MSPFLNNGITTVVLNFSGTFSSWYTYLLVELSRFWPSSELLAVIWKLFPLCFHFLIYLLWFLVRLIRSRVLWNIFLCLLFLSSAIWHSHWSLYLCCEQKFFKFGKSSNILLRLIRDILRTTPPMPLIFNWKQHYIIFATFWHTLDICTIFSSWIGIIWK